MRNRVMFITSGLKSGGAEKILYQIVLSLVSSGHEVQVISLTKGGYYKERLNEIMVPVYELDLGLFNIISATRRSGKLIRQYKPNVIQTWMYHADLIGGLISKFYSRVPVIWGIRNTTLSIGGSSISAQISRLLCVPVSYLVPKYIISCSREGIICHIKLGYCSKKFKYIPNGISLDDRSKPKIIPNSKRKIDILFSGRNDNQKNIIFFLDVISSLFHEEPEIKVSIIGRGMDDSNQELSKQIDQRGLGNVISCYGFVEDTLSFYRNTKLLLSVSKYGEAFPNIALEAMMYDTIPIFLDVGDAEQIISQKELVLPINSTVQEVAKKVNDILILPDSLTAEMRKTLQTHVRANYDIKKITKQYKDIYNEFIK
jgi:glycosyltransferase involved in cell wall biosynthesis